VNVDLPGLEGVAMKDHRGRNRIKAAYWLGRVDEQDLALALDHPGHLLQYLLDRRYVLDGVKRDHCIESVIPELQAGGRHRSDPRHHCYLGGVGVQVDPDCVDPEFAQRLHEMALPATHVEDPITRGRSHPVANDLEVAGVPAVDQRVLAGVVAPRHASLPRRVV
jgi:hypothetical protein